MFGTPLPFVLDPATASAPDQISADRLQHFLWVLYPHFIPGVVLRPDHSDLIFLSHVVAEVLRDEFAGLPNDSSVKRFLHTPDQEGWHVKRKLVWLGTKSYLFRLFCREYVERQNPKESQISVIDDFLCQQTTEWAGQGALEVLAGILDLPPNRRVDLLSWSRKTQCRVQGDLLRRREDRGLECYQRREVSRALEFQTSSVRSRRILPRQPGPLGWRVVPGPENSADVARRAPKRSSSSSSIIVSGQRSFIAILRMHWRRCAKLTRKQYDEFVASHGKDWQLYPSALDLAADFQKSAAAKFAALPEHDRERLVRTHGPQVSRGIVNLSPELTESSNAIGVYFNPNEGMEIVPNFDDILSGLKKNGIGLTAGEENAISGWMRSHTLSPGFGRRLVEEFGIGSIAAAFLLENQNEDYLLEYLLRRYSGNYFRPRSPTMMLV